MGDMLLELEPEEYDCLERLIFVLLRDIEELPGMVLVVYETGIWTSQTPSSGSLRSCSGWGKREGVCRRIVHVVSYSCDGEDQAE